jgi:AmmeMemoRadiSam system protein A
MSTTTDLSRVDLDALIDIAERSIRVAVLDHAFWRPDLSHASPGLRRPAAAFVTLHRDGLLRGCIGTFDTSTPLAVVVADRARAAALEDPRFLPVRPDELVDLDVSVSVLSAPEPLAVGGYDELVDALHAGLDGVVVDSGPHRATLLPSVWDELPDPHAFVAALWRKAGLPPGCWPSATRVATYRAQHAARPHP